MQDTLVEFKNVFMRFGEQEVLSDFNLSVRDGEFFTVLGPSGCGKTTVLRLLAGFEQCNEGQILLSGEDIAGLPPERRPINTVFQSYALFPHMSVFDNVAFGLKMSNVPVSEIKQRVLESLELVQLEGFESRKPHQLSGGQKQRVAIARAIVNRPKILLLDESLSALDAKLRLRMQMELRRIQRQLGITFIYVTHDQEEALSMSDRIMVMNYGQPQQIGTPRDIYETPSNLFVARFIGEINVFDAEVMEQREEHHYLVTMEGKYRDIECYQELKAGTQIHLLMRPEDLRVEYLEDAGDKPGFKGKILEHNYKGKTIDSLIELESGHVIRASEFFDERDPDFDYQIGQSVWVDWVRGWEHVIKSES